jgi:hypothetical protein
MAYTVEITDGVSVYTFDVTRMPEWSISTDAEYDQTKYPAALTRKTDTLTLKNCSYRNATPSNVTTDLSTLKALLFDRLTPVSSVVLKDGVTTIESMTTLTHDQLMVTGMTPSVSAGYLANHWLGTITVVGVDVQAGAGGIVKKDRQFSYSWDANGFETRSVSVSIETLPGTSASGKMAAEAIELPAANWFYETNSPDGINYSIEEDSEDTKATGTSTVKEQAILIPSGANQYSINVSTREDGSGKDKTTTYSITAQANTLAAAKTAAASGAPTGYTSKTISEDRTRNSVTATYTVASESDTTVAAVKAYSLTISNSGRSLSEISIPGHNPIMFKSPARSVTVRESVSIQREGDPAVRLKFVPSMVPKDLEDYFDENQSSDSVRRVSEGSIPENDVFSRSVSRVYRVPNADDVTASLYAELKGLSAKTGNSNWLADIIRGAG